MFDSSYGTHQFGACLGSSTVKSEDPGCGFLRSPQCRRQARFEDRPQSRVSVEGTFCHVASLFSVLHQLTRHSKVQPPGRRHGWPDWKRAPPHWQRGIPEGIFGIAWFIVTLLAIIKVIQETKDAATPLWLAFVIFVPCIGGILALVAVKRAPKGIDP